MNYSQSYIYLLLVLPLSTVAQDLPTKSSEVTIEGTIVLDSADAEEIAVAEVYVVNHLTGKKDLYADFYDEAGHYRIDFPVVGQQEVMLRAGHLFTTMLVAPGDRIQLKEYQVEPEVYSLEYQGGAAKLNQFWLNYTQAEKQAGFLQLYYERISSFRNSDPTQPVVDEVIGVLTEFSKQRRDFLHQYLLEHRPAPKSFLNWANLRIQYYTAKKWVHVQGYLQKSNHPDQDDLLVYLDSVSFNPPNALFSLNYMEFIYQYRVVRPGCPRNTVSELGEKLDWQKQTFQFFKEQSEGLAEQLLLSQFMYQLTSHPTLLKSISELELLEEFKAIVDHPYLREGFLAHYERTLSSTWDNPSIETAVRLFDAPEDAKAFIPELLRQHSGKILYLDFWATWCGPCMQEMPYYEQVMQQLDTTKIAFVFLSISSPPGAWEAAIDKFQLVGSHHQLSSAEYGVLQNILSIRGIPHHAIIDSSGVIVSENAPGPREAVKTLEQLFGSEIRK